MAKLIENNKNTMTIELKAGQVVLDENGLEFEIEEGDSLMFAEKKKESEDEPKEDKDEKKKGKKESEDEESDDKESDDDKETKDDKESEDKDEKKKKKEKKNLTFLYTDSQLKEGSKNPYSKVDFESEFIGNNLQDVDMLLNDYDLDGHGVSPVIDNDGEIVGFVYDFDNDGYFNGHAIEDLGLFSHLDYFVYEL